MHKENPNAYCFEFNEQGYCKICGEKKPVEAPNGKWPTGTWFQNRRAYILNRTADEMRKVQ